MGGLLFLLPRFLNSEKRESKEDGDHNSEEKAIRDKLVQLERLLIHANIPVSGTMMILGYLMDMIILTITDFSLLLPISVLMLGNMLLPIQDEVH